MPSDNNDTIKCPVDESSCWVVDELTGLRREAEKLRDQVHTDTLTGLYNYRHFALELAQELERTRRSGQPTSLILIDLDHFKKINDTWGHEVGNQVLRLTASLIRSAVRRIDIPCRYGGEEFALILPGTQLALAVNVAERLREEIASTPLELDGEELRFTASMGATLSVAGQGDTVESFVDRADKLLYEAKRGGRNRVCHSEYRYLKPDTEVSPDEKRALFE